jgi:hypothetical protein
MTVTRAVLKLQTPRIANRLDLEPYAFLSEMIKIMLDEIGDFCLTIGVPMAALQERSDRNKRNSFHTKSTVTLKTA